VRDGRRPSTTMVPVSVRGASKASAELVERTDTTRDEEPSERDRY
jgi:hypothetical protein